MIKLTNRGPNGKGPPETTHFQPGDVIRIGKEPDLIRIDVLREGASIFLGAGHDTSLCLYSTSMTVEGVWLTMNLFLKANWILMDVIQSSKTGIYAEVLRIATCSKEMDAPLSCCDAGGDGLGGD